MHMAVRSLFAPRPGLVCRKVQDLAEFVQGRERLAKGQYQLAELELKRALQILDNSRQTEESSFALLMTDIARALAGQGKTVQAGQTLEKVVERLGKGDLEWPALSNLLAFYLSAAPEKASQLTKTLLSNPSLREEHKHEARLIAGSALLLQGDPSEAISLLQPAFPLYLQPFARHNLGCAQWWSVSPPHSPAKSTAELLFPAVSSLHSAITAFENTPNLSDPLPLLSPYTCLSLTTLGSVHLACGEDAQASKWLKVALKCYQKHAPGQTNRPLILLAGLLRREKAFLHAEGMLQYAIDQLAQSAPCPDQVAALKEYALTLQSNPKREREWQSHLTQAALIETKLPPWAVCAGFLHLPTLQSL